MICDERENYSEKQPQYPLEKLKLAKGVVLMGSATSGLHRRGDDRMLATELSGRSLRISSQLCFNCDKEESGPAIPDSRRPP